ncbi:MAG TPA: 30S ribosomal protein S4 [Anaerolineaceae bacterium]|nr:30S ribosomal protein S4 [Anaerolineaceae bacterium]
MGRDRGPKNKLSRREGKDLFGTGSASLQRRLEIPPGVHGRGGRGPARQTEYAKQLRAKQTVKRMYGMRERQFRRFFQIAQRTRGKTGEALLKLLERRLDNVVYRMGLARTRPQARQFVTHGHVMVNGSKVDIPSYLIKPGDKVEFNPAGRTIPQVADSLEQRGPVAPWIEVIQFGGHILREPERSEIDQDINETAIVEFYSR